MIPADLDAVQGIAGIVHPGFFERREVLAEKQQLYPAGAWFCEVGGKAAGYLLSHPWPENSVPALDALLGAVHENADSYYIHDLALLPDIRGVGAAGAVVRVALAHATTSGFTTASLVAVNGSQAFWEMKGFGAANIPALAIKLQTYEPHAQYMTRSLV